jgi:hypothetical protein
MVLTRRTVVVPALVAFAMNGGCKQSLFDSNTGGGGPDGGGGGDGSVASSCPATCLADAAADFGKASWRYLEDLRIRSWTPLTAVDDVYVGSDANNRITTCAANASAAACSALPGALLVSTAGAQSTADPAVSYTATENGVIQLTVRAHVPAGAMSHDVRLYRNSREDSLFTAAAAAGVTLERAITVDALKDDRFYVALAPKGEGATESIGLHVYINATEDSFPKSCKLALAFSAASGTTIANACGAAFTYYDYNQTPAQTPTLTAGPYAELGMAADIPMDHYYRGADVLVRDADTTTQLWVRHDAFVSTYNALVFSDLDLDATGGVGIYILNQASPRLYVETCTFATQTELMFAKGDGAFPDDHAWHFIRVVHTNGMVQICLDGVRIASYPLPAGKMQSTYRPYVGKNVIWTPSGAFFDGAVDDVRVLGGALPCELSP